MTVLPSVNLSSLVSPNLFQRYDGNISMCMEESIPLIGSDMIRIQFPGCYHTWKLARV